MVSWGVIAYFYYGHDGLAGDSMRPDPQPEAHAIPADVSPGPVSRHWRLQGVR